MAWVPERQACSDATLGSRASDRAARPRPAPSYLLPLHPRRAPRLSTPAPAVRTRAP